MNDSPVSRLTASEGAGSHIATLSTVRRHASRHRTSSSSSRLRHDNDDDDDDNAVRWIAWSSSSSDSSDDNDDDETTQLPLHTQEARTDEASTTTSATTTTTATTDSATATTVRAVLPTCKYSGYPPRYRYARAYFCHYCTYTVCVRCFRHTPAALRTTTTTTTTADAATVTEQQQRRPYDEHAVMTAALARALAASPTRSAAVHTPASSPIDTTPRRHDRGDVSATNTTTATAGTAASARTRRARVCVPCHLCRAGQLVCERALLHAWSCEGPAPLQRLRRGAAAVYDTALLQRYYFAKEQRSTRAASTQRLVAHYHGRSAHTTVDATGGSSSGLDASHAAQQPRRRRRGHDGSVTMSTVAMRVAAAAGNDDDSDSSTLCCDARRAPCCLVGGSFDFSVANPRLTVSCVWCAVNVHTRTSHYAYNTATAIAAATATTTTATAAMSNNNNSNNSSNNVSSCHGTDWGVSSAATTTPLLTWSCPPTLPTLPPRRYRVHVATDAYARGVHALALYETQAIYRKATTQLAQQRVRNDDAYSYNNSSGGGGGLVRVHVPPAQTLQPLLVVYVLHYEHVPRRMLSQQQQQQSQERKRPRAPSMDLLSTPPLDDTTDNNNNDAVTATTRASADDTTAADAHASVPPTTTAACAELATCVDHLLHGRSVAVYGIASKAFFLHHVAHCAALQSCGVYVIDAATTTTTTTTTAASSDEVVRRLGEVQRLLRLGTTSTRPPQPQQQRHQQRVCDDTRSASVSRNRTTATMTTTAAARVVDVDGDDVDDGDTIALPSPSLSSRQYGAVSWSRSPAARHDDTNNNNNTMMATGGCFLVAADTREHADDDDVDDASPYALLRFMCQAGDKDNGSDDDEDDDDTTRVYVDVARTRQCLAMLTARQRACVLDGRNVVGVVSRVRGEHDQATMCKCNDDDNNINDNDDDAVRLCRVQAPVFVAGSRDVHAALCACARAARRRCVRWHALPSVLATPHTTTTTMTTTTTTMTRQRTTPALPPSPSSLLLVLHNIDRLDAAALSALVRLCQQYAQALPSSSLLRGVPSSSAHAHAHAPQVTQQVSLQLLVSFDRPEWTCTAACASLDRVVRFARVQLCTLLQPRAHTRQRPYVLLSALATASNARGRRLGGGAAAASAGGGGGAQALLMHDTMRRILLSLPSAFTELLRVLLHTQEAAGESRYVSLFAHAERLEQCGHVVSHGRLKALQRELTSNRLAIYHAAEHALLLPQHRKLLRVLDEVTAQRDASRNVGGGGGDTHNVAAAASSATT